MARISVEVPDEQLIELIERTKGLVRGEAERSPEVEIETQPPVDNSIYSHIVTVSLRYAFKIGELDELIRP